MPQSRRHDSSQACPKIHLRGTTHVDNYELCFKKCEEGLNLTVVAYSDSEWASSLEDR